MKKIFLLLLIASITFNLFCQRDKTIVLDSTYSYRWFSETTDWVIEEREIFNYDVNGNRINCIRYNWDLENDNWIWSDSTMYKYDVNRNPTERISNSSWKPITPDNDTISLDHRSVYIYNANGNLIDSISYYWDLKTDDWAKGRRYVLAYDAVGNQTEWTEHIWDSETNDWVFNERIVMDYNTIGEKTEEISYKWDSGTNDWISTERQAYTYDNKGNLTQVIHHLYYVENNDGYWIDKIVFTYDENGNLTERLNYSRYSDSQLWKLTYRQLYTYDTYGNLTKYDVYIMESNEWLLFWGEVYAYDTNGNKTEKIYYGQWDSAINDWNSKIKTVSYWSELTTSISNNIINLNYNVYPNPFTDYITIKLSEANQVQKINLIDIHGRIIITIDKIRTNSITIHRENLPSGIYFIRIHSDDIYVHKVIIR